MSMLTREQHLADETEHPGQEPETQGSVALPDHPQKPMVGWYDPRQLVRTGMEVLISTILGRHSDHRLVEALASEDQTGECYDYTYYYNEDDDGCIPDQSRPRKSIWIDYAADVGDGWNSTYAIASHLATPRHDFRQPAGYGPTDVEWKTCRGDILVFGGDQVYPTASRHEYEARLYGPYDMALHHTTAPHPHVFAIPGNHDWYDSLVAFTRFFTARRWFAGWRTRQKRSYFALRLPHNWWLLGSDLQLGSDIDCPQLDYFTRLLRLMKQEERETGNAARIVLCHAEPHWLTSKKYGKLDPIYEEGESNLRLLEKRLENRVVLFLAGDLHYYRRHEAEDLSTQKIVAGGGGAFLHPTHSGLNGVSLEKIGGKSSGKGPGEVFIQRRCFPPPAVTRRLCWRNLLFPYFNVSRTFGLLTAVLYLLLTSSVVARLDDRRLDLKNLSLSLESIAGASLQTIFTSPVTIVFVVLCLLGVVLFTDSHSTRFRVVLGGIHGLLQVSAAFWLATTSTSLVTRGLPTTWVTRFDVGGFPFSVDWRMLLAFITILVGGYVLGSFIMGLYLLISMNVFGRHSNEAFSSLAIQDWKNSIRMHVDEEGSLWVFPIGIRRVPRKWRSVPVGTAGPRKVPDDPKATDPELIEPPIVFRKTGTGWGKWRQMGVPEGDMRQPAVKE